MELNEYDFEAGDEFSDLKLIVEDKVLHVHKAILSKLNTIIFEQPLELNELYFKATSSPVFKRMLSLQFRESLENEIKLPDKKLDDILELLKYLYPNFSRDFNGKRNIEFKIT